MTAPTSAADPLRRELRLFYLFRLLATSYLYVPIFMLFQEQRGLSFFQRLALGGVYSAVVILVDVPTGVFADRLGRRRSMMLGATAMVISCAVALRAESFASFAVAEALAAMSMALCSGADTAYLYDLLARHGRGHEYAQRESSASAMHLLGSAIAFAGGGLVGAVDLTLPYVLTAAVAALALAVAMALSDDRAARPSFRRGLAGARQPGRHRGAAGLVARRGGRALAGASPPAAGVAGGVLGGRLHVAARHDLRVPAVPRAARLWPHPDRPLVRGHVCGGRGDRLSHARAARSLQRGSAPVGAARRPGRELPLARPGPLG
ncbi:MAG: MFS transporter, partial [Myxococcales bacterium]|nr:MFS transporter [Myxococcales bacterium]